MTRQGLNRRHVLLAGGSLLLAGGCQGQPQGAAAPTVSARQIDRVGLQTYTLRNALAEDFEGTFRMIKDVGYDFVELNGRNFADRSPTELRALLDTVGLPAPASHVDYSALAETPAALAETMNILGCDYAILPWVDADVRGADDYRRHAEVLNRAADTLRSNGVRVAYHNHQFEFDALEGGKTGMDILLSETDSNLVDFELDLFWAALAGIDIPALLRSHPDRFKLCHIKDMSGDPAPFLASGDYEAIGRELMVDVGEGDLPFETYFAENDVSGMRYFIAEHDQPKQPYRAAIATSHDAIRAMRF